MTRWVVPAIVAVAATMLFTGCGAGQPAADATSAEHRIGIVFDLGGRGDMAHNDLAYDGLVLVAQEFGGFIANDPDSVNFGDLVEIRYVEPRVGGQDREQALRGFGEAGFDLVFGLGFAFTEAAGRIAQEFPNTHFALIDAVVPDGVSNGNLSGVSFAENEGSFLVGALAGMMTRNSDARVGFIGGMDIPLIHTFHGGFAAGAMHTNAALRSGDMVMAEYIGQDPTAFYDPQSAEQIAQEMYDQGARIIFHASGGSGAGIFQAAYDRGRWAIGVEYDQAFRFAVADTALERAIGERIVTSMLKRIDRAVFLLSSDLINGGGRIDGGAIRLGLEEDGVGFVVNNLNREMLEPHLEELELLRAQIISGEILVPDRPTVEGES